MKKVQKNERISDKEYKKQVVSNFMSKIGKKGGDTTKKKGSKYYSDLAKKRWNKLKK